MATPAPFHRALADGPEGGHALWVTAADGVRLRVGLWPAAGAKGTVLLFTGRSEYVEKYGRAAAELARRGYATATLDWRGQGLSDRLVADPMAGHVNDFRDYQADVQALLAAVRAQGLPERLFLVAHSMGGCIGLRALHEGLAVGAVAFSAPMWGIRIAPALRPLAWAMTWTLPKFGYGERYAPGTSAASYVASESFADNTLTHDAAMYAWMQAQLAALPALALGGPSLHWLHQALIETRLLRARPPPPVPAITHVGTEEKVVDPVAIAEVMTAWPGGVLTLVDGAEHEIMMEVKPVRDGFFDAAAGLFDRNG